VPVASLQHHFPTLEVLRREALRNKVRAELTSLAEQVALIADPWERIYHVIVTSVSLDPARRRGGWVLWLEYWHAAAHDPELAEDSWEVNALWPSAVASAGLVVLTGLIARELGAETASVPGIHVPRPGSHLRVVTEVPAIGDGRP